MARNQTDEPLIQVAMAKDGTIRDADTSELVARYLPKTQVLEFASTEADAKYRRQCIDVVTMKSTGDGTQAVPTGRNILEFAIKGRTSDVAGVNIPPKPTPRNQKEREAYAALGDTWPPIVEWYFKHKPQAAYARYRVFLDESGQPVRRDVARKSLEMIDDRDGSKGIEQANNGRGQIVKKSSKQTSFENGPVQTRGYIDEFDQQIIALRKTSMTFHPNEVIGGFDLPWMDEPSRGIGMREEDERE